MNCLFVCFFFHSGFGWRYFMISTHLFDVLAAPHWLKRKNNLLNLFFFFQMKFIIFVAIKIGNNLRFQYGYFAHSFNFVLTLFIFFLNKITFFVNELNRWLQSLIIYTVIYFTRIFEQHKISIMYKMKWHKLSCKKMKSFSFFFIHFRLRNSKTLEK